MTTQSQSNTRALQDVARYALGHTPGPWAAEASPQSEHFDWLVRGNRIYVGICTDNSAADARLIAAAPAMLTALQGLFHRHNDGSQEGPWAEWDTAVEAIVKATGNQP